MNEKFFALPEEKRQRIINAAMEVFGKNEYKRASTDLIAVKAGISKGLLFYYFHNKKPPPLTTNKQSSPGKNDIFANAICMNCAF